MEAVRLYRLYGESYLNRGLMVLEHFKYPEVFMRRSKKAYITVLDDFMIRALDESDPITYNAVRLRIRRMGGQRCSLHVFRKIWATYMRLHGIDPEVIDLLQGRTPRSIFLKHYYRPDIHPLLEEVRQRLGGLRAKLGAV